MVCSVDCDALLQGNYFLYLSLETETLYVLVVAIVSHLVLHYNINPQNTERLRKQKKTALDLRYIMSS